MRLSHTHKHDTQRYFRHSVVNISNPKPNPLLGTLSLKKRVVSQMCVADPEVPNRGRYVGCHRLREKQAYTLYDCKFRKFCFVHQYINCFWYISGVPDYHVSWLNCPSPQREEKKIHPGLFSFFFFFRSRGPLGKRIDGKKKYLFGSHSGHVRFFTVPKTFQKFYDGQLMMVQFFFPKSTVRVVLLVASLPSAGIQNLNPFLTDRT